MEPTTTVPTYIQKSLRPKWLIPLSIASLVILVAALASGITYALINNSNNTKASSNTVNTTITTPLPTTLVQTSTLVTSTPSTTTIVPSLDAYIGWKEYKNNDFRVSFMLPSQLYINNKLITVSIKDVTYSRDCQDYLDSKVLKNISY